MSYSEIDVVDLSVDVPVVDVRELDEYTSGHVPGARHIALSEITSRVSDFSGYQTVYLVCQMGGRSARACEFLSQQSELAHVSFVNVAGGTGGWIAHGREVVTGDQPN